MSEDDLRRAKCTSKITFDSMGDARVAARKTNSRRKRWHKGSGPDGEPYHCRACGYFHIGRDVAGYGRDFKYI